MKTTKMKMMNNKNNLIFLLLFSFTYLLTQKTTAQTKTAWIPPKEAAAKVNPVIPNETSMKEAKKLYMNICMACHGEKGKGDGIASIACNPKPADHTSVAIQNESDGSLFWKITVGRGPMPNYKTQLTDNQRWELVNYIRTLCKPK